MYMIRGMRGLGDCIYQRAFVRRLGECWIDTPWPELYSDLPVHFARPDTNLRTQSRNIARQSCYQSPPYGLHEVRIAYGADGIYNGMRRCFGVEPGPLDLPLFWNCCTVVRDMPRPYVLVRPATIRAEWRADARNPDPAHLIEAAQIAAAAGYHVVSVADLEAGKEWLDGAAPPADTVLHACELGVYDLLALVQGAAAVIGGIGWLLPAAIASHVPAWIICGGQGGYNAPGLLTDHTMQLDKLQFAVPDNFCRCKERQHTCDKRISNHAEKFASWLRKHAAVV